MMRRYFLLMMFAFSSLVAYQVPAQIPTLPVGAKTHWVVDQPEEIVCYFAFDPATVTHRLPPAFRFISLEELAIGGVRWAMDYLAKHSPHGQWGISFLEITRMRTFTIDGQAPVWPTNGAVALWCARVAQADSATDFGPGRLFLVLDFWVPDSAYVAFMCRNGHYATFGDVRLFEDSERKWHGSIRVEGLSVTTEVVPIGPVREATGSAGMQVFIPPRSSAVTDIVRAAFAGHREQECKEGSRWILRGSHPLVTCIALGPSIFEFGYHLIGGAYRR